MRRGPEPGKVFPLDLEEIKIGRGSKNTLIIHDNEVSRNHLRLIRTTAGYELHDLNSSNGTYVNGQKVDSIWLLQSQCIIELGDSITLEYRMGRPEDDPEIGDLYRARAPVPVQERSYLVVNIDSHEEAVVYPLEGMAITVGRATSNDIVIVEPELSREHFRLTLMPEGYYVEDLGSTNGTFVNGEPLETQRLLYANDVIQIGTTIRLRLTNSPESFMDHSSTSLLDGDRNVVNRRKTSRLEVPNFVNPAPAPTEAGTGVDHKSLEDDVLISYARADWEKIVAPLVDKLYEAGIQTWVDQYLVEESNDWILATEQARLECWLLVVVVSQDAMRSDMVRKNWRHFQNREKPIVLLMYEPIERMPIGASRLTRVQYNPGVPEVAFQQVVRDIRRLGEHQGREIKVAEGPEGPEIDPEAAAKTTVTTIRSLAAAAKAEADAEKPDTKPRADAGADVNALPPDEGDAETEAVALDAELEVGSVVPEQAPAGGDDEGAPESAAAPEADADISEEAAPATDTQANEKPPQRRTITGRLLAEKKLDTDEVAMLQEAEADVPSSTPNNEVSDAGLAVENTEAEHTEESQAQAPDTTDDQVAEESLENPKNS